MMLGPISPGGGGAPVEVTIPPQFAVLKTHFFSEISAGAGGVMLLTVTAPAGEPVEIGPFAIPDLAVAGDVASIVNTAAGYPDPGHLLVASVDASNQVIVTLTTPGATVQPSAPFGDFKTLIALGWPFETMKTVISSGTRSVQETADAVVEALKAQSDRVSGTRALILPLQIDNAALKALPVVTGDVKFEGTVVADSLEEQVATDIIAHGDEMTITVTPTGGAPVATTFYAYDTNVGGDVPVDKITVFLDPGNAFPSAFVDQINAFFRYNDATLQDVRFVIDDDAVDILGGGASSIAISGGMLAKIGHVARSQDPATTPKDVPGAIAALQAEIQDLKRVIRLAKREAQQGILPSITKFQTLDFTNGGANNGSIQMEMNVNGGAAFTITIDHTAAAASDFVATPNAVTSEEFAGLFNAAVAAYYAPLPRPVVLYYPGVRGEIATLGRGGTKSVSVNSIVYTGVTGNAGINLGMSYGDDPRDLPDWLNSLDWRVLTLEDRLFELEQNHEDLESRITALESA